MRSKTRIHSIERTRITVVLVAALLLLSLLAPAAGARADDGEGEPDLPAPTAQERQFSAAGYNQTIKRSEVMARAETWMHNPRPYSQRSYSGGYRTDCSGFVSMAWHLSPGRWGGMNTQGLRAYAHPIGMNELKPGDILLDPVGTSNTRHVVLFQRWVDPSRTSYWAYEQVGGLIRKTAHRAVSYPYPKGAGQYSPWRFNRIVDDVRTLLPSQDAPGKHPYELVGTGDLNANGEPDFGAVQKGVSAGTMWLYPGHGSATFGARAKRGNKWDAMREVVGFEGADGQGGPGLLALDKKPGRLWLYPGTAGTYGPRRLDGWGGWAGMSGLVGLGRTMPGAAYPDLFAVETATGDLWRYDGSEIGFVSRSRVGTGWNAMRELSSVKDLTGDGWDDLIAVDKATGRLWLYPGTATGPLGPRISLGTGWDRMRSVEGVGDLTDDGFPDVLSIEISTGRLWLYRGKAGTALSSRVLLGTGWNG
jgi:hypothetical protein